MDKWSNKYIGLEYLFGINDCLRLVEKIYLKEKNFHIRQNNIPVAEDWYAKNPNRLIKEAIEIGEVINDTSQLREFDMVVLKINKGIRHIGVMVDNYGHFVHQMIKSKSRLDDVNERHWRRRFYCAIRPKFTEQI